MPPRRFTLDEAQNLLPQLAPLLWEMRDRKQKHDALRTKLEEEQQTVRSNGHGMQGQTADARRAGQEAAARIKEIVGRVRNMGCELKDIDMGLVDFRHVRDDGHEIYLCWKLGEPGIEWWHELDAGYASRQRLTPQADD